MPIELVKRALKDKAFGAILIALLIFLYTFWLATFFPQAENMGLSETLQSPALKAVLGDQAIAIGSFSGFMAVEAFSYMGLIIGAYIAFLTASFVAGEIEQKTSDLLLSLPVSRESLILQRFTALIPIVLLLLAALLAAICGGALYLGADVRLQWFMYALAFLGALLLAVGAGSLLISSFMSDGKKAALVSVGMLFAMYVLENIGSMVAGIGWARQFSLFHYARLIDIVAAQNVNWANLLVLVGFTVCCLVLAVIVFKRRDINVS